MRHALCALGILLGAVSCGHAPRAASPPGPAARAASKATLLRVRWDALPKEGDDFTAGEEVIDLAGRVRLTTVTWGIEVVRCWDGAKGWQKSRGRVGDLGAEGRTACQRILEERVQQLGPSTSGADAAPKTFSFARVEEDGRRVEVRADYSDFRPLGPRSFPWVSTWSRDGKPSVEIRLSSVEWFTPSDDPFAPPVPDRSIEGDDVCLCCGGRPLESTKLGEVPVDSLRDPETQVAALFPQADRYATRLMSFLRKGGQQEYMAAGAEMGGPWDPETEGYKTVYPFYPAYAGDKLLGYAFCSSSPGAHGKVQLAVALDLNGRPLAARVQAINSERGSVFVTPEFQQALADGTIAVQVLLRGKGVEPSPEVFALDRCVRKASVLYAHFLAN